MFLANLIAPIISSAGYGECVLQYTHCAPVRSLPATFVSSLVEKVLMVAEHMVQNPQVCGYPGVQCVEKLEQAVERFGVKCERVLMVMIPGTDHTLGHYHQKRITRQPPDIVHHEVNQEVDYAQREH